MKTQKEPEEFPVNPVIPEIEPSKNIPEPSIQPECPPNIIPVEKPETNNPLEIEPETDFQSSLLI